MSAPPRANPYIGPYAFEEADEDRFFGRDQESDNLLSLVISEGLVLFFAQSGAGKTSLVNTRLIPGLRQRGFSVLPVARVGGNAPEGLEPANIFAFNLLWSLAGDDTSPESLVDVELADVLARRGEEGGDAPAPKVLILDQFEEFFSHHLESWTQRDDFFHQIESARKTDNTLSIVFVMREDRIAGLQRYSPLLSQPPRFFRMERLRRSDAVTAIHQPADLEGLPFAEGVAEQLAENLSQLRLAGSRETVTGEYVEPVQLQVVCFQLWQRLQKERRETGEFRNEVSHQDLERYGDVDQALETFYLDAVDQVAEATKISARLIRQWCGEALITSTGVRAQVPREPHTTRGLRNYAVDALIDSHLIRAERARGGLWYELAHDRFIEPILKANERKLSPEQTSLGVDARAWDDAGGDPSFLYQGQHLKNVLEFFANELGALAQVEQKFLGEGKRAEGRRVLEKNQRLARRRTFRFGLIAGGILALLLAATFTVRVIQKSTLVTAAERKLEEASLRGLQSHARITAIMTNNNLNAVTRRLEREAGQDEDYKADLPELLEIATPEDERDLPAITWALERIHRRYQDRKTHYSWLVTDRKGKVLARAPADNSIDIVGKNLSGRAWFHGKEDIAGGPHEPRRETGRSGAFYSPIADRLLVSIGTPIRAVTPPRPGDEPVITGVLVTSIEENQMRRWLGMKNDDDVLPDDKCVESQVLLIDGQVAVHPCRRPDLDLPLDASEFFGNGGAEGSLGPRELVLEVDGSASSMRKSGDFVDHLGRSTRPHPAVSMQLGDHSGWTVVAQEVPSSTQSRLTEHWSFSRWVDIFELLASIAMVAFFWTMVVMLYRRREGREA